MSTLLQKDLKVNRTLAANIEQVRALDDKARIKILQILYRKQLSAEQIANELHKAGYKKAITTVRHHLDVLKQSGLVEIVKMEEMRGAVMKFYGTSIKILGYKIPPNFDLEFSKSITDTSIKMEKIIKNLDQKSASKIKKKNIENSESEHDYNKYILLEIVNRALTNVFENNGFDHSVPFTKKQ
jgi:DNA-binding transcriptional ArsR family regulator